MADNLGELVAVVIVVAINELTTYVVEYWSLVSMSWDEEREVVGMGGGIDVTAWEGAANGWEYLGYEFIGGVRGGWVTIRGEEEVPWFMGKCEGAEEDE